MLRYENIARRFLAEQAMLSAGRSRRRACRGRI
jgi:hypothetical protein